MISHKFQTVFVHIPKTAGQSIESAFLAAHGLTWEERAPLLLRPNDDPAVGPPRLAHLFARDYVALGHITARDFDRYYKFSVVRNPYDRAVSSYNYVTALPARVRRMHETSLAARLRAGLAFFGAAPAALDRICERDAFAAFTAFFEMSDAELGPKLARFLAAQSSFLCAENGRILVDRVIRFENLKAEITPVLARLLGAGTALAHKNAGPQTVRLCRDGLSDRHKAVIHSRYREDFERFDYLP